MQEAKASKLVSIEKDLIVGIDQKLDKIIHILERIADQKERKVVFRELSCHHRLSCLVELNQQVISYRITHSYGKNKCVMKLYTGNHLHC